MKKTIIESESKKTTIELSCLEESSCYISKVLDSYYVITDTDVVEVEYTQDGFDLYHIRNQNAFSSRESALKEDSKRLFIARVREFAYGKNLIKDWFPERNEESYPLILPPVIVYFKNIIDRQECLEYFEKEHIELFDKK